VATSLRSESIRAIPVKVNTITVTR